jgi:hypothetical protein
VYPVPADFESRLHDGRLTPHAVEHSLYRAWILRQRGEPIHPHFRFAGSERVKVRRGRLESYDSDTSFKCDVLHSDLGIFDDKHSNFSGETIGTNGRFCRCSCANSTESFAAHLRSNRLHEAIPPDPRRCSKSRREPPDHGPKAVRREISYSTRPTLSRSVQKLDYDFGVATCETKSGWIRQEFHAAQSARRL